MTPHPLPKKCILVLLATCNLLYSANQDSSVDKYPSGIMITSSISSTLVIITSFLRVVYPLNNPNTACLTYTSIPHFEGARFTNKVLMTSCFSFSFAEITGSYNVSISMFSALFLSYMHMCKFHICTDF